MQRASFIICESLFSLPHLRFTMNLIHDHVSTNCNIRIVSICYVELNAFNCISNFTIFNGTIWPWYFNDCNCHIESNEKKLWILKLKVVVIKLHIKGNCDNNKQFSQKYLGCQPQNHGIYMTPFYSWITHCVFFICSHCLAENNYIVGLQKI